MVRNGLYIDEIDYIAWFKDDLIHRLNGPAIIYSNGDKCWCQNDDLHKLDGPAVEFFDGKKEWWYQNQLIDCSNQEEFDRLIKLRLLW